MIVTRPRAGGSRGSELPGAHARRPTVGASAVTRRQPSPRGPARRTSPGGGSWACWSLPGRKRSAAPAPPRGAAGRGAQTEPRYEGDDPGGQPPRRARAGGALLHRPRAWKRRTCSPTTYSPCWHASKSRRTCARSETRRRAAYREPATHCADGAPGPPPLAESAPSPAFRAPRAGFEPATLRLTARRGTSRDRTRALAMPFGCGESGLGHLSRVRTGTTSGTTASAGRRGDACGANFGGRTIRRDKGRRGRRAPVEAPPRPAHIR
jgi:hypothetical protein